MYFSVAGYFQCALMYRFIHPDVQMNVKKPLFFLVAFTDVETINQQYSLNSSSNRLFTIERL